MRTFIATFSVLAILAITIAVVGVDTQVLACGGSCIRAPSPLEEAQPAWSACDLALDCLRL